MIEIYLGQFEISGYTLYNPKTNIFMHSEICSVERIGDVVTALPDMHVVIYVDKDWTEALDDLLFHAPQLRDVVKIQTLKKLDTKERIRLAIHPPVKKRHYLWAIPIGIAFGALALFPISQEYKESVSLKANTVKELAQSIDNSRKNMTARTKLMKDIKLLNTTEEIKSVKYSNNEYSVVLTSEKAKKKSSYFGLPNSRLANYKAITKGSKKYYVYEIGGHF